MWVKILSISSILLGLFIIFNIFRTTDFPDYFDYKSQYHMGCYNTDNTLNHSSQMKQYLNQIQEESNLYLPQKQSFSLSKRIDLKQISIGVARDFEKYLSEYYQIKTKAVYQQKFYQSLALAQEKFQNKKQQLGKKFDKIQCLDSWNNLDLSRTKLDSLKDRLRQKIQRKQQQERKVSYLILNNNYADSQEFQRNITNQINILNSKRQNINGEKIQIFQNKAPLQRYIASNKSKLEVDQNLLDECVKNAKIIKFCNQLNEEIASIKVTFTKQQIQTKIQRKRMIIDSFHTAIKNAEKIGDRHLLQMNKQNLLQNQQQLTLLEARIQDFKTFQQSYCSKCSEEKIIQLKQSITIGRQLVQQYLNQLNDLQTRQATLDKQLGQISLKIQNLEQQRDFHINSNLCDTPQCQQKRSKDLKQLGKVLNQMKRDVLDYKWTLEQHRAQHENKQQNMNNWHETLSEVVDCLYDKQYFQNLKQKRPEHSENQIIKIKGVRDQLVRNLQALAP